MSFAKEFKEFAVKGNAVDMAVGIIVGAAFGKIITSLVNDVIMPPIGILLGGADFSKFQIVVKTHPISGAALNPSVDIRYGAFINTLLDFLIVAFCVFLMVKAINMARKAGTEGVRA